MRVVNIVFTTLLLILINFLQLQSTELFLMVACDYSFVEMCGPSCIAFLLCLVNGVFTCIYALPQYVTYYLNFLAFFIAFLQIVYC